MMNNKPDIKIFVSHRIDLDSETINNPLYVNVRCGAVYDKRENITMLGDDTGDNISEKRNSYCELTVQYWAWKNVEADYYGLCHYRRYLNFSNLFNSTDIYGNIIDDYINNDAIRLYGLDEETMKTEISKFDLLVSSPVDVSKFPERYSSLETHFAKAKYDGISYLKKKDLQCAVDIISELYPEYLTTAQKYLAGNTGYFCNLFIMKKDIFFNYCEWLFTILKVLEERIDMSHYGVQSFRTPGHISERLLGIYISYHKSINCKWKIKTLSPVIFMKPQLCKYCVEPMFGGKAIPIVFAANEKFVPIVSVAINSVIKNSNINRNYDIFILEQNISTQSKMIISSMANNYTNISIRFVNVTYAVSAYTLVAKAHISVETFYRFLTQDILPKYNKVLYLDCDLVCLTDVAELYDTDISDYMLAATLDPDFIGQVNLPNGELLNYALKVLKLNNPFQYFQAGVLLFNTEMMRNKYSVDEWLTMASEPYKYSDQDVLNRYCQGFVKFVDMSWNVLIECNNFRMKVIIPNSTEAICSSYLKSRENPKIIHYAGYQKPWNQSNVDYETYFWQYARETPYYEKILNDFLCNKQFEPSYSPNIGLKGAIKIYIKKKIGIVFPRGTRRRTFLKKLYFKIFKR